MLRDKTLYKFTFTLRTSLCSSLPADCSFARDVNVQNIRIKSVQSTDASWNTSLHAPGSAPGLQQYTEVHRKYNRLSSSRIACSSAPMLSENTSKTAVVVAGARSRTIFNFRYTGLNCFKKWQETIILILFVQLIFNLFFFSKRISYCIIGV